MEPRIKMQLCEQSSKAASTAICSKPRVLRTKTTQRSLPKPPNPQRALYFYVENATPATQPPQPSAANHVVLRVKATPHTDSRELLCPKPRVLSMNIDTFLDHQSAHVQKPRVFTQKKSAGPLRTLARSKDQRSGKTQREP